MCYKRLATVVSATVLLATIANADVLPKTAKPLSANEVRAIYSGKTAQWKVSNVYFSSDGKAFGYTANKKTVLTGNWTVSGKTACMNVSWRTVKTGENGKSADCWDWYRDGDKTYSLWSKRYNGSKPKKDEYSTNELRYFKKGNLVATQYAKLTK